MAAPRHDATSLWLTAEELVELTGYQTIYRADKSEGASLRLAGGADKRPACDDPIADLKLKRATRDDFEAWRDRFTVGRRARTVNRYVRAVAAGLNRAIELGHVGNPAAWRLRRLCGEEEGETAFLGPAQRSASSTGD